MIFFTTHAKKTDAKITEKCQFQSEKVRTERIVRQGLLCGYLSHLAVCSAVQRNFRSDLAVFILSILVSLAILYF